MRKNKRRRVIYCSILLFTSGIGFTACGSHQSNLKQKSAIEERTSYVRKDTSSVSRNLQKTEVEEIMEETEEITTVYDTNKPIDSITGKPPILSETRRNNRKESGRKKEEKSESEQNLSTKLLSTSQSLSNEAKEEDKQIQETTLPRQIGWLIWAIVAFLVSIIVGRLIFRRQRKIDS